MPILCPKVTASPVVGQVSSSVSGNGANGISVGGGSVSVQSSTSFGNVLDAFVMQADSASIKSSTFSGNGVNGIDIIAGGPISLKSNHTDANGFPGGSSNLGGLGISVVGYATPPTGKNAAHGNDDPAGCDPTYLC